MNNSLMDQILKNSQIIFNYNCVGLYINRYKYTDDYIVIVWIVFTTL